MLIEEKMKNMAAQFDDFGVCWNWPGYIDRYGYGQVKMFGKTGKAHRASYYVFCGSLIPGRVIMHTCDNRACFNPTHLRQGTYSENSYDMYAKGRRG